MNHDVARIPKRSGSRNERTPAAGISTHSRRHRSAVPTAGGGRLRGAIDARRQPGEVASGAHHVVFRNVPVGASRAWLSAVRSAFFVFVQFLLLD